jgi:hypothetical protein
VQKFCEDTVRDRRTAKGLHDLGRPEIPTEFTVIFSEGRPRHCKLAWRIGFELGAQFVD